MLFVHVDSKVDLEPFELACGDCANVFFVQDRIATYWGDFSYVEASVSTLRLALSYSLCDVGRFVLVQGSDYPLMSDCELMSFYADNEGVNFVNGARCDLCGDLEMDKYRCVHRLGKKTFSAKMSRWTNYLLKRLFGHGIWLKRPYVELSDGSVMDLYSGWAQFSVTREAAEYFVSFHDEHPEFNSYFSTVYAADESYFQTIFYNSPLRSTASLLPPLESRDQRALLNNTYFEYPVLVTEWSSPDDYETLVGTGMPFFRKVDSKRGRALLDRIDEACGCCR